MLLAFCNIYVTIGKMFANVNNILQTPLFNILFFVAVSWSIAIFLERFHIPIIIGELLAGILIGPAILGIIHPSPEIDLLASLGMFFLMFYAGLETDPRHLRNTLKPSVRIGFFGVCLPLILGTGVSLYFNASLIQAVLIGIAISGTSMVTKLRILNDLKLEKTQISYNMMGASIVDNVILFTILTIILKTFQKGMFTFQDAVGTGLEVAVFFAATLGIGYLVFPRLSKFFTTRRGKGFTFALLMGFLFAFIAEALHLPFILGAYFAGLFVREEIMSHSLFQKMRDRFLAISYGFLGPIFIMSIALKVNLGVLSTQTSFVLALFGAAFFGKLAGVYLGGIFSKIPSRESMFMGLAMNGRGEIELVIALIGLQLGIITQNELSIIVMVAFATTFIAPFMLNKLKNSKIKKVPAAA